MLRHPVFYVFLLALLARVVVAVVFTGFFSGTHVLDDGTYSNMASDIANDRTQSWDAYTHGLYERTAAFVGPLAVTYEVFGENALAGQIMVAILGAGVAAIVTRLALEILTPAWAVVSGIFIALLPSQVLWSSLILKDAAVWLTLCGIGLAVAVANRSRGIWIWVAAAAGGTVLLALAHLRLHTLVVACWALFLAGLAGRSHDRLQRLAALAVVAIAVPWVVGAGPAGITFVANAGPLEQRRATNAKGAASAVVPPPEQLADDAASLRASGSARDEIAGQLGTTEKQVKELLQQHEAESLQKSGLSSDEIGSRLEMPKAQVNELLERADAQSFGAEGGDAVDPNVAHLPRGLLVMLLEPLPWRPAPSAAFKFGQWETVLWYPLLLLALIGLPKARHHLQALLFPIIIGGGILVMYALSEGNIGTAYRHRGEVLWVAAILAALGVRSLDELVKRRARSRAGRT